MVSQVETSWRGAIADFEKLEKAHEEYLHKLQDITKQQQASLKAVKQQTSQLNTLRDALNRAEASGEEDQEKVAEIRKWLGESRGKLKEMQSELPVQSNGFYLSLILGSNLNLSLMNNDQRYNYKQEYEAFKWKVTSTVVVWVLLAYLFPWRVIDSLGLFLLVWYYCTLTIRESILTINGSKIKGWWVLHHYFSTVLCGIVLIWKDGACYQAFRSQFLVHVLYICGVQLLQSQYQSGCLRRLHSLGQGHQMDITVEGFTSFMFKGLTFLLPFLIVGYFFQLYNAYTLWTLSYSCEGEWNVTALCYLFFFLASGNISTTSLVIFKKMGAKEDVNHHLHSRSYFSEALHFFICAGGILLCYFYFGVQQERVVQGKYENGEKFVFTQALVLFMCAANTIFAWLLRPKKDVDTVPTKMYGICAASYLGAMICSNQALQYLPYPTQVLAKSCKPIPVMLFGVFFAGKKYSLRKYMYVLMIVAGVMMFLYKDKKAQENAQYGLGEILLLASLAMDGTTTAIQDTINKNYKRSGLSMMYYMNLFSSIYLLFGLVLTGEVFSFLAFVQRHPKVLLDLSLLAASSCGGQYFIFKTIAEFSPLTCSVITTTRKLFTIIISVVFMNHPLSDRQSYGTAIVFGGLFMDAVDSKMSRPKPAKPAVQ